MSELHKYNMGVIGNCSFLAFIDLYAEVKWMCMPRFDSSFVFGSLIAGDKGGRFSILPANEKYYTTQYYIDNTNVLCTEFHTDSGSFRVTDFAPRFYQYNRYFRPLMLIRKVELISGCPLVIVNCNPVGNYGELIPEIVPASNHIRYLNFENQVRLTTNIPLHYIMENKPFIINDTKHLVFTYGEPLEAPLISTCEHFLVETVKYWQNWVQTTSIVNFYQDAIIRSALILKLHQYEDTGGIIASGSMGLPEYPGSGRNWDYRYCWLRDAYYTLNAFNSIGHFEELEKYFQYIQNIIVNRDLPVQPVYTISGGQVCGEKRLGLPGYMGNQPIWMGNNAVEQKQHDVYGQILVSLLPLFIDKRLNHSEKINSEKVVEWLLDHIEAQINEPDSGIWEYRNIKQRHLYTNLFHWAGCKAAYKIGVAMNNLYLRRKAEMLIKSAKKNIESCYEPYRHIYNEAIESEYSDASSLQLIIMKYLNPDSKKAKDHLEALEKQLKVKHGLFHRYIHEDDFGKSSSTFLVCAFWYAEALACTGRLDDAVRTFEYLMQFSNHLGLFSEDVGMDGSQWGNFPQTYSHVGLMNAAFKIAQKLDMPLFY